LISSHLLSWYDQQGRSLPWRRESGAYELWLCEIIMQQTQVATGIDYWYRLLKVFPSVADLAEASIDQVLSEWAGLGYYRRAHQLHKAAIIIHEQGHFPMNHAQWLKLPGVGPYTASALASYLFKDPIAAIDGNANRVYSRLFDLPLPVDKAEGKQAIQALGNDSIDKDRPGDFNQAIMDLGSQICKGKKPACDQCPVSTYCLARERSSIHLRPVKSVKITVKKAHWAFMLVTHQGKIAVTNRNNQGIWPGLVTLPASQPHNGQPLLWSCNHALTHMQLHITIHEAQLSDLNDSITWVDINELSELAWPQPFTRWLREFKYI